MRDVLYQQAQQQEGSWRKEREMKCSDKPRAQFPESSVGEDRTLILGFLMMTFSILMYLMVGIMMVKPCVHSDWTNSSNCTLVKLHLTEEVMDCRGNVNFQCVRAWVNVTLHETSTLQLFYDEDAVNSRTKCFYTPKCQRNKTEQETEARKIKQALITQTHNMSCFLSPAYPEEAICRRKYSLGTALRYLLWPSLMLFGGILLVGLVKLNQHLAFICSEISREELMGKQRKRMEGHFYRLLRSRPRVPVEQHDPVN
ncbi:hypothetical protein DNTS_015773 [Danionella cerebrum]|uniref:Uncharacterized protein n=1 Tax=Danionella cerebrum TaxID=2873325 RepID=A0A553R0R8_9TELE|nr:hypothetical protein DNTS_015773 [Danionella translucida]